MTTTQLDRAVARATGETVCEVRRRGFSLADAAEVDFDPEPDDDSPLIVNWDELDPNRVRLFS